MFGTGNHRIKESFVHKGWQRMMLGIPAAMMNLHHKSQIESNPLSLVKRLLQSIAAVAARIDEHEETHM